MTAPNGTGIINRGTTYANGDQVTAANLNALSDNAEFNTNAIDDSTIGLDGTGQLFVKDDGITSSKIIDGAVTFSKYQPVANNTIIGNIAGAGTAPTALVGSSVVTAMGTALANPSSISGTINTVTLSNGLIIKFGAVSATSTETTIDFSAESSDFPNAIFTASVTGLLASGATAQITMKSLSTAEVVVSHGSALTNIHYIAIGY
jgi:hypothetical protein